MPKQKKWYKPQLFWCSYCGNPIWIQDTPVTQPEMLICDECTKSILDKQQEKGNKDD